jgi:hypothetical protein
MRLRRAVVALCAFAAAGQARALELHGERSSPYDLAITGRLAGVASGATRYARWSDLCAMPTSKLTLDGEFVPGPQVVTVVFLDDLWKALPVAAGADTFLAKCSDGYASVFTSEFIATYKPFLILEINGKGPKDWPPPGLTYNPGPYVVSVSASVAPSSAKYRDLEHKKPWGVTSLEVASYADRFSAIYAGAFTSLSATARDGREIWVNSCASCHEGPSGIFGGTKAARPFQLIAAFALHDRTFFEKYVRDPKSLVPSAQMEPHPHYTDAEMAGIEAFIAAAQ